MSTSEARPKQTDTKQTQKAEKARDNGYCLIFYHPDPRFGGRIGSTYADLKADDILLARCASGLRPTCCWCSHLTMWVSVRPAPSTRIRLTRLPCQRLADEGLAHSRFHTTRSALVKPRRYFFRVRITTHPHGNDHRDGDGFSQLRLTDGQSKRPASQRFSGGMPTVPPRSASGTTTPDHGHWRPGPLRTLAVWQGLRLLVMRFPHWRSKPVEYAAL